MNKRKARAIQREAIRSIKNALEEQIDDVVSFYLDEAINNANEDTYGDYYDAIDGRIEVKIVVRKKK